MWWDESAADVRWMLAGVGMFCLLALALLAAGIVETKAASAPLDEHNPCTLTVWRMSGTIDRIEARNWPTIEHQMGGGVRLKFTTEDGTEEIGGMLAYHIRPKGATER